jgi:hypothetical protein
MDKSANPEDPPYSFPDIPTETLKGAIFDFFEMPHEGPHSSRLEVRIIQRWKSRQILNIRELSRSIAAICQDCNIVVSGFDRLSLKEQIEFVRAADILIGMHGTELALMMFMKPNATVVEIFPYKFTCRDWYERAANFSRLRYVAYHPESETEVSTEIDDARRKCFDGLIECSSPLCLDILMDQNLTVDSEAFRRQVRPLFQ